MSASLAESPPAIPAAIPPAIPMAQQAFLPTLEPVALPLAYARLQVRVVLERSPEPIDLPRIRGAADVQRDFAWLAAVDRETFLVLLLDQKNRVTGVQVASVGSLAASLVHPREVFKAAILGNAAAIIVVHNHPSGDPTPSREDREITARLRLCGQELGIPLVDHVVIGAEGYRSFAEAGIL